MVGPLMASEDSFQRYKGTVKEINHDEVVLTDVLKRAVSNMAPGTAEPARAAEGPRRCTCHLWELIRFGLAAEQG